MTPFVLLNVNLQALCNASGELDAVSFERVIRRQLQLFIQVKRKNHSKKLVLLYEFQFTTCIFKFMKS